MFSESPSWCSRNRLAHVGLFPGEAHLRKLRERKTSLLADKSPEVRQARACSAMNSLEPHGSWETAPKKT